MPTSSIHSVPSIIDQITALRPESVLELGIGYGKYGALLREYLDAYDEHYRPSDWTRRIVGVEGFQQYRNPMWECYSAVNVEDFCCQKNWHRYSEYDLVLMIDSLEHVPFEVGDVLLNHLKTHNRNLIVSVPDSTSQKYEQGAWGGNEYERHRAHWTKKDLVVRGARIIHSGVCVVGLF